MAKVWIVDFAVDYEGATVVGVYDNFIAAMQCAAETMPMRAPAPWLPVPSGNPRITRFRRQPGDAVNVTEMEIGRSYADEIDARRSPETLLRAWNPAWPPAASAEEGT